MRRWTTWLPLALFLALVGVVALQLYRPADRTVRSALVGKPMPGFVLKPVVADRPGLVSTMFADGHPRLVNVFASWCIPCIAEAPQLMQLKRMGIEIDGIAIHDQHADVAAFLGANGNPYTRIGDDPMGSVQLSLGSSGVPESFVIDGKGRIVLQHVGGVRDDDIAEIAAAVHGA